VTVFVKSAAVRSINNIIDVISGIIMEGCQDSLHLFTGLSQRAGIAHIKGFFRVTCSNALGITVAKQKDLNVTSPG
jgi:hypothetical protein